AEWINYKKRTIVMTVGSKTMMVDEQAKSLDVEPVIINGNLMVPLRAVSEALGAKVEFDAKTRSIDINLDSKQIIMQINVKEMIVSGEKISLSVAPMIRSGRTYVPFRAIAEAFGCEVKWASETKEVTIIRLWY
ncbi:MAG: copper amine oxidase N-terminal domain-containing protein, partial [Caldiserica bacterium]|nr:copper amine oxidase N-terminal domain-containing protein [Caldisericota bacterium]